MSVRGRRRKKAALALVAGAAGVALMASPAFAATSITFEGPSNTPATYAAFANDNNDVDLIDPAGALCTGAVGSGNVNNLPDSWNQDDMPLQSGGTVDVSHVYVTDADSVKPVGGTVATTDVSAGGLAAVTLADHDPFEWHGSGTTEPASDWCLSDGDLSESGEIPANSTTGVRFDFDGATAGNGKTSFGIWIDDCESNTSFKCRVLLLSCTNTIIGTTAYPSDTNNAVDFIRFTAAPADGVCAMVVSSAPSAGPGASVGWGTPANPRAYVAPPSPVVPEGKIVVGVGITALLGGAYLVVRSRHVTRLAI